MSFGPPSRHALILIVVCLTAAPGPRTAVAYDFEVTSRTEAHGYQLRRYDIEGMQLLNRRRLTQWLGLRIFNLLDPGQEPWSPRGKKKPPALLTVHGLFRLGADFGSYADREAGVPEVERSELDLLLLGLEGRGLFGWLDVDLGRQLDMELMDFFAYDGLRVRANLPLGFYVEALGGVQVAGSHPLSSAVFETEGVPGDRSREAWSPSYGVAAGLDGGPAGLQVRLAYRGVVSHDTPPPLLPGGPLPAALWGIDQEALFFGARVVSPWLRLRPQIGLRYNLLTAQLDEIEAGASLSLWSRLEAQVEYQRSRPHFDGDSILNLFSLEPTTDLAGRLTLQIVPQLAAGVRLGHRWFWSDAAEQQTGEPGVLTAGLVGTFSGRRLRAELEGYYQGGRQGATLGADLDGDYRIWRWLAVEGRLSWLRTFDEERKQPAVLAFGVQTGARFTFWRGVLLHLLLEDNISRLYSSALRLLAVLDLEVAP